MTITLPMPTVEGGWGTIVADPPWNFNDKGSRAAPDWKGAKSGYATMSDQAILALPVGEIAAPKSHLYLWTTDAHLSLALQCIKLWKFDFKHTISWIKRRPGGPLHPGMGHYFRKAHELVLFATRGKCRGAVHNLLSVIEAPRGKHSAKPELLQKLAEQMSPGPRLELFARRQLDGWTVWGDEADSKEAA